MRVVGKKVLPTFKPPSGESLLAGARFNDEIHRLPTGGRTHIPKGIYRFKTHEEANEFDLQCLAKHMARIARERNHEPT